MSDRTALELLTRLFPADEARPDWPGFVDGLSQALSGACCGVWSDNRISAPLAVSPPEMLPLLRAYDAHPDSGQRYMLEKDFPLGNLFPSLSGFDEGCWQSAVLKPAGLSDEGLVLPLASEGGVITSLLNISCREGNAIEPASRALVGELTPWLLHAIRATRSERHNTAATDAFRQLIDRLTVGVILLDARAQVVFANGHAATLLEQRTAPAFTARKASQVRSERLRAGLDRLLEAREPGNGARPRYIVSRLSLEPGAERPFDGQVEAAIVVEDTNTSPVVSQDALRKRYGMTPAEARLAVLLVSDLSVEQAAEVLGVKVGTARTRLKMVFAKTGTNRQASLILTLLAECAPPIAVE